MRKYPTLHLIALNTDQDHVHLQIEIPPDIAIADAVRSIKARSSLYLRKKFNFIDKIYLEKDGIWSVGYFVSSIGIDEEKIKKYIDYQDKREKPQTARLFWPTINLLRLFVSMTFDPGNPGRSEAESGEEVIIVFI